LGITEEAAACLARIYEKLGNGFRTGLVIPADIVSGPGKGRIF